MNLLILAESDWQIITTVPQKTVLGLDNSRALTEILQACQPITDQCGCISWSSMHDVYTCEAFGGAYTAQGFASNLEGCLYYSFHPEPDPVTHCQSQHQALFRQMNQVLENDDLFLSTLQVSTIQFRREYLTHDQFKSDPALARLIADLLTYNYVQQGKALWQ